MPPPKTTPRNPQPPTMQAFADPALRHLLPALRRLREPWIASFFNPTTEQHLSQLEHALRNQTLTGTLRLSPAAPASDQTAPQLTFIFAPSFSTGATTVGFDLTQRTSDAALPPAPRRSLSRAVRDDASGFFLSVSRRPAVTEIALSRLTPSGRSISLTTVTNDAYEALLQCCADPPDPSAVERLANGVIGTMHGEDGLCPAPCAKLHPMDFAAERRNVECFVNGFQTIVQFKEYQRGRLTGTDWCFARMAMGVSRDGAFVRNMRHWAIQQAVSECRVTLPRLCVPGAEVGDDDVQGADAGSFPLDGATRAGEFRADDIVRIISSWDDTCADALFDSNALALMSGEDGQDLPFLKDGLEDIDVRQDVTLSKSSVMSAITQPPPHTSVPQDEVPNSPMGAHSSSPESGSGPAANNHLPELAPQQSPSSAYVIEHVSARSAVRIAPRNPNDAERTVTSESQRKAERRKARNRASALRSNEKKRLYLQRLKEDISAVGKREVALRERERLLREKNWQLRIALRQ